MNSSIDNKTKKFIAPILSLAIVSIVLVSAINIYVSISIFKDSMNKDIEIYKKEYLEKNKNAVFKKVHFIEQSIKFQSKKIEKKLKKALKERIKTSLNIAQFIYDKEKGKLTNEEIRKRIAQHLSAIRFNGNRGYYFTYNSSNNIILGHAIKKFIGKDMTNFKDLKKQNLVNLYARELQKNKIAFTKIYFRKPMDINHEYPKLVCITKFKQLNMIIGTGEYLDFIENQTKLLILERYSKISENYIFILDLHNINGGNNFATVLMNPNKPELINKKLNDNFKGAKGKEFFKESLKNIRKTGESYTKYWYKKPNTVDVKPKMSYFYYEKNWNWIIGSGFYFDDLEKLVQKKEQSIKNYTKRMIVDTIKITILLCIIVIFFAMLIAMRIDKIIKKYIKELSIKSLELKKLNESLESQVKEKTKQNIKQLQILQQQSKMAAMGEMIGAIAHQWRQPLNAVSTSIQNLKYDFKDGNLNSENFIDNFINKNKKTIKFMSKTIDDFRSFFRIDKEKIDFKVKETTQSVIDMQEAQLKNYDISLSIKGDEFIYNGLQNEYQQVILNLINNAKDALLEKNIQDPTIDIILSKNKICIQDNAQGIPKNIIDRIFEPYFTTKEQGKGTGMGLYISKMIIEDNMGGNLFAKNTNSGALFCIEFDTPLQNKVIL